MQCQEQLSGKNWSKFSTMSPMPQCQTLLLEQEDRLLNMTFNRPDQRNAINRQMVTEIAETVDWLSQNQDIHVVVLRGSGGQFCAGGDIKERRAMADEKTGDSSDPIAEDNRLAGLQFLNFERLAQTTIAAVEGAAFGGGMGYACLTDITIVTRGARMGMPETGLGIAPAQIAPYVVKRIGLSRARQLALTGERFSGVEAYQYGIAHYLCDNDAMDKSLQEVVARVLKCGPRANAATKNIMNRVGKMADEELIRYSAETFAELCRSEEGLEGQMAFKEKRKPSWR
jgi:isohexenylglutaconyl-CoA hydratase